MRDDHILEEFVGAFAKLDGLDTFPGLDPAASALRCEGQSEFGCYSWRPRRLKTHRSALETLYRHLPYPFPPLYENLVLNYRWAQVELGSFTLLANPLGADLDGLKAEIFRDAGLFQFLLPAGFLQFGRGSDNNYDPVCFHLAGTTPERARVVRLDHEELLCDEKLVVVEELALDCHALFKDVIERARAT